MTARLDEAPMRMIAAEPRRSRRRLVFSEVQTRKALKLAAEQFGDAGRVVIGPDGSIAIEKTPGENSAKRADPVKKDFVL